MSSATNKTPTTTPPMGPRYVQLRHQHPGLQGRNARPEEGGASISAATKGPERRGRRERRAEGEGRAAKIVYDGVGKLGADGEEQRGGGAGDVRLKGLACV